MMTTNSFVTASPVGAAVGRPVDARAETGGASADRTDENTGVVCANATEFEKHTEIEYEGRIEMGVTTDGVDHGRNENRATDADRPTPGADGTRGRRGLLATTPAAEAGASDAIRFGGRDSSGSVLTAVVGSTVR